MAIQGRIISVGTTATQLTSSTVSDQIEYNFNGQSILVQNPSTTITVYLGGSDVTSSNYGYSLSPLATFSLDLRPNEQLYAAVASSTQNINVIRQGV